jgi:opacity protein-like surface antigen
MNKMLKLSAIALLASSTSLMAQSKGVSVAVFGAIAGAEVKGSGSESDTITTRGSGSVGQVTPIGGFDISYHFPISSGSSLGFGGTYIPIEAEIGQGTITSGTGGNVSGKLKDHYTLYVQPALNINKDSAVYFKVQYAHADLQISGATGSDNLTGWGGGIGLKTFLDKNTFIQAEANYTEYDSVSGRNITQTKGLGTGSTTTTVSGTPYLAQGIISIGYQF